MDFYSLSTHAKGLLTIDQIEDLRKTAHDSAYAGLPEEVPRIGFEESCIIRRYYQDKISGVCSFLKLPKFVQVRYTLFIDSNSMCSPLHTGIICGTF